MAAFNRLYELHGRREREGESSQLLLGQGILLWRRDDGDVRHPIVTQRLELLFDPAIPEFTIVETDQPAELVRALLFTDHSGASQTIQGADEELASADFDLLDLAKMEGPLRRLAAVLHAEGRFMQEAPTAATYVPQVYCDPVIFLSRRTQGFSAALDYVLEDLDRGESPSTALLRISGIDAAPRVESATGQRASWEEPADILFTKEANEEQIQIADRLDRHDNVLVQGPPGTGKTHTIANLVGHLLAQGQRILITAHTSKALRVLREKVVEPLQTLCVSVLDNETESRKQLEASVDSMVARLSSDDPAELDRLAEQARSERERLRNDLTDLRRALINARQDECRDIVYGGEGTQPSTAARFVAATAAKNNWIPGPIQTGAPLPVSGREIDELYSTNRSLSRDDERELRLWRPAPEQTPGAQEFGAACLRWAALSEADTTTGAHFWSDSIHESPEDELLRIAERIHACVQLLYGAPAWKRDAIVAGMTSEPEAQAPWRELIARIEALRVRAQGAQGLLLDRRCTLSSDHSFGQHARIAAEILMFIESGRRLTTFGLVTKPGWRRFLKSVLVNDGQPRTAEDFAAIEMEAALGEARQTLGLRWDNQVGRRGGALWREFGARPESGIASLIPQIQTLVAWQIEQLTPLVGLLEGAGFNWRAFVNEQEVRPGEHVELSRLIDAVVGPLGAIVAARMNLVATRALERQVRVWHRSLFSPEPGSLPASAVLDLRTAIDHKSHSQYNESFKRLSALHSLAPTFERRLLLLGRLQAVSPRWATAVQGRVDIHGEPGPPGDPSDAWKWTQFWQELESRSRVSMSALEIKIADTRARLREVTARLIELRSWSAQCKRVGLEERQALQGWKDINRRIGKGTGARAPGLRVEARRTLAKARNAVPVWIMPLARVAETFDPRLARFNVVIIDEASQCDLLGLLAVYLGERVVVVGDHEQVSPLAVGQEISEVARLIEQHLNGIPNNSLYDGKMSLYDLARQSFGGVIRLLEHFRCVPEIIAFSNDVSYKGEIKPLRESASSALLPSVVPFRLEGVREQRKVNKKEAEVVVSLLQAALEQPEYAGKTFGVVSLLGEEQAVEIESLARQSLPPGRLVACQFLCGTAAQFQGDERDVMFASLVDSPADGPLTKRDIDMYRQRFNVAASRPKDQLWVVHSLDPRRDLQPGDLRRRLIEHAEDPRGLLTRQLGSEAKTESEFERLVLGRLSAAGYKVTPQWPVGRYRIDLVVEGTGRRLAVECDGDRYHPLEKIAEDMARQAVLERLGWTFVRIRGNQFFRSADEAMKPVFDAIERAGITTTQPTTIPVLVEGDLAERVKRRAADILRDRESAVGQLSNVGDQLA